MTKPYIGPSEAQSEALYRREHVYTAASDQSFRIAWTWDKRQPRGLRDAADMIRRAYAAEVPTRMHNRDLADDGTPKMTPQAEGFIFGNPHQGEAQADEPLVDYYRTPFRAALATLRTQSEPRHDIILKVASGQAMPITATIEAGVPHWAAGIVAENVINGFMRTLSDLKVNAPPEAAA